MKRISLLLLIGLIGFAIGAGWRLWGGSSTAWAQMEVSDFLLVSASGPRLGARPARTDIALVMFDQKTAVQLGYVHSFAEDVKLYDNLLQAGARVVLDTRGIAAAESEAWEELRPLLDQMLAINDQGRLMRDVWLSSSFSAERYECLLTQNVINSHPHALPQVAARLYPIAFFTSTGAHESAPLAVCRQVWGLPRAASSDVGEELRRSGILGEWHRQAPEMVPANDIPPSPYRIGDHRSAWYPFQSTSPLVPPAAFWVSYDPPVADFQRHSFAAVLNQADAEDFREKVVIIGFDAEIDPTSDSYAIPNLFGKASSAEVVACATATLLDDRQTRMPATAVSLLVIASLTFTLSLVTGLLRPLQAAVIATAVLLLYVGSAIVAYRSGWYVDFLIAPLCAVGSAMVGSVANAWHTLRSRQRVVDLFGRYVPRAVVNELIQRSELQELTLGGVKRDVTVLFADIRGFTNFSQDLPPEDVVSRLNSLLEILVACTFEHGGTLDKFIGDAILVLFNAPLDQVDHVERAARTAISMQQRLAGHATGLYVGIGVHRGEAIVGNIGTPQRMEYTAIGSTVNIASRLCDAAQPGEVVISQAVLDALPADFMTESSDAIRVKGIKEPIAVARLLSTSSVEERPSDR